MENFNRLTPAQTERLSLLAEECGEVIQAIGKILRHGYHSTNPYMSDMRTNRNYLETELADVQIALSLLYGAGDLTQNNVNDEAVKKLPFKKKFWHHQNNT